MCVCVCVCVYVCVYIRLHVSVCLYVAVLLSENSLDSPSSHPSQQEGDCNGTDM